MQTDENIEKIRVRFAAAFQPFRCVAEILDYEQKLRFKVVNNDGQSIIETKQILLRHLMDDSYLEDLVEQAKSEIRLRRPIVHNDYPTNVRAAALIAFLQG